jgi:hypothetical protein
MKLNTAEKLKQNILSVYWNILQLVVHQILQNVFTRCETCLHAKERHLKQITVTVRTINIILHGGKKWNLLFYHHEERLATSQLLY